EGEHPAGLFRVVAQQSGGDRGGLDLGQGGQPAVLVPGEVGVVQRGQQDADQRRDGGGRDDVLLGARVAEDQHPVEVADQLGRHLLDGGGAVTQGGAAAGLVVGGGDGPEERQLRLEGVHLVQGPHDAVDEVRVVDAVGGRLGEGDADAREDIA